MLEGVTLTTPGVTTAAPMLAADTMAVGRIVTGPADATGPGTLCAVAMPDGVTLTAPGVAVIPPTLSAVVIDVAVMVCAAAAGRNPTAAPHLGHACVGSGKTSL